MALLGIDYGQSRIGLAIAVKSIVSLYETIKNQNIEKTMAEIQQICKKENIDKIVLGMPKGKLSPEIDQFGKKLEEMIRLPVIRVNEVMTSWEAEKKLVKIKKKGKIDQVAAALILQRYLDENY